MAQSSEAWQTTPVFLGTPSRGAEPGSARRMQNGLGRNLLVNVRPFTQHDMQLGLVYSWCHPYSLVCSLIIFALVIKYE